MGTFEEHLKTKERLWVGDIVRRYKTETVEYVITEISHRREFFKLALITETNKGIWTPYEEISEVVRLHRMRIKK